MNVAADSIKTVNNFLREKIRTMDGVDSSSIYPVVKSKRFAPLSELIKIQQEHMLDKSKKVPKSELDEEYAMLTGAFPRDLE